MREKLQTDKGVAGLTILLSVITILFSLGLLVTIFALMGGELRQATYTPTTVTVTNESGAWINTTKYTVDSSSANGFRTLTITALWNVTNASAPTVIGTGNVTVSGTGFTNATATTWTAVNVSYTYVYDADNDATNVISNTTDSISSVVDWYDIFIVISAMVVLILLTVIIIGAIKQSGLMASEGA